ncbi:unnamed protein product [Musa acuminata subsp. burmannicoides]
MDASTATATETSSPVRFDLREHPLSIVFPGLHETVQRRCFNHSNSGICRLFMNSSVALHVLSSYGLEPDDLARLEASATCSFFRQHGGLPPDERLPLTELAAFDMCRRRVALASMAAAEEEALKQRCGGSYKLLLKYLLAGERACDRREKFQVVAGPGFSIAVTSMARSTPSVTTTQGSLDMAPCRTKRCRGSSDHCKEFALFKQQQEQKGHCW